MKKDKELTKMDRASVSCRTALSSLLYVLLEFWKVIGEELKNILRNYGWKFLKNGWTFLIAEQTLSSKKSHKPQAQET